MAQKTVVTIIDDLDGSTKRVQTMTFALDGQAYEIDLSEVNAGTLREVLADYVSAARKVSTARRTGPARRGTTAREQSRAVRAWATSTGRKVSARGRIPEEIQREYDAEHKS
jgi:hypothetical protein